MFAFFRILIRRSSKNSEPAISESGTAVATTDGVDVKSLPLSLYNGGNKIGDTTDDTINSKQQYIYDNGLKTNEIQKKI